MIESTEEEEYLRAVDNVKEALNATKNCTRATVNSMKESFFVRVRTN